MLSESSSIFDKTGQWIKDHPREAAVIGLVAVGVLCLCGATAVFGLNALNDNLVEQGLTVIARTQEFVATMGNILEVGQTGTAQALAATQNVAIEVTQTAIGRYNDTLSTVLTQGTQPPGATFIPTLTPTPTP